MKFLIVLLLCLPLHSQTVDKPFVQLTTFNVTAMIADARVSSKMSPYCFEADPLYGKHPSETRYYAEMSLLTAGATVAGYYLKKHHKKLWMIPAVVDTTLHVQGWRQSTACYRGGVGPKPN